MAAIKASPFWDSSYEVDNTQVFPLQNLHASMGDFVRTPTTAAVFTDRGPWGSADWDGRGGTLLRPTETGPLYELYFGHIPAKNEYASTGEGAKYVYEVAGGGKELSGAGSGGPGGPGIMLKDAYDAVVDIDTPLTVSHGNTAGRTVVPTITGAPAGYTYLQWETPRNNGVATLSVVGMGPELASICPVVIPQGIGTVTMTVRNCTSTGVPGTLTASFKVEVIPTYSIGGKITLTPPSGRLAAAEVQLMDSEDTPVEGKMVHPDSNGVYTIPGVANGTYTIEVSLNGYVTNTISNITVSSGNVTGKDLTLAAAE
jgi:hypothetical protein